MSRRAMDTGEAGKNVKEMEGEQKKRNPIVPKSASAM